MIPLNGIVCQDDIVPLKLLQFFHWHKQDKALVDVNRDFIVQLPFQ